VASHLTEFFLWMSIGGVVGGILVGIVAPFVFNGVYEYPIALFFGLLLRPDPGGDDRVSAAIARITGLERAAARSAFLRQAQRWALDLALPFILWNVLAKGWLNTWFHTVLHWLVARYPGAEDLPIARVEYWGLTLIVVLLVVALSTRPLRCALVYLAVLMALSAFVLVSPEQRRFRARSFFGVYTVTELQMPFGRMHYLAHGTTTHGGQNLDRPLDPITYYPREGPAGQFFEILDSSPTPPRRFGTIGLGVGGLSCYVNQGQRMTYFEIDPLDERIARDPRFFTYLKDAGDRIDVVIGDGRLSLAKEPDGEFDALIVDAFSGDAIPAHLLTREAFELYFRKLREDGLLLVHISNAFLDLFPVVANLAADAGLAARFSSLAGPIVTPGGELSDWVVLARRSQTLARFESIQPSWQVLEPAPEVDLWTDDYTNVVQALRWQELGGMTQ
jgi:spermidine synthase